MNDKIPPFRYSLKRLHRYELSFEFKSPVQIGREDDEFLVFLRLSREKVQKYKIFVKFRKLAAHLLVWLVASAVTSNNESIMTSQIGQSSSSSSSSSIFYVGWGTSYVTYIVRAATPLHGHIQTHLNLVLRIYIDFMIVQRI